MPTARVALGDHQPTSFGDDLVKTIPKLRAFASSLCHGTQRGDDLVQATLVKALANAGSFEAGSNLIAWLYTILRNEFYTVYRKRRHEVEDGDGRHAAYMRVAASQEDHIHFLEVRNALEYLTAEHREALMMNVAGLSYQEAATLCGHAVGTMKSRVNRARVKLTELLADRLAEERDFARDAPIALGHRRASACQGHFAAAA